MGAACGVSGTGEAHRGESRAEGGGAARWQLFRTRGAQEWGEHKMDSWKEKEIKEGERVDRNGKELKKKREGGVRGGGEWGLWGSDTGKRR